MPKNNAKSLLFFLYLFYCAVHRKSQSEVWFFILPCDWRFLPELGPPPPRLAGFFHLKRPCPPARRPAARKSSTSRSAGRSSPPGSSPITSICTPISPPHLAPLPA